MTCVGPSREIRAGIVVTGTELLTGVITDRNGPWVAERLGELGVEVAYLMVVGDRPEDLDASLHFLATQNVDLIVTTGGLGPTADDLTAEVVARFAGVELVLDEAMEARIAMILAGFAHLSGFDMEALRAANRKQAMVPRGATPLDPAGTAPGLVVPANPVVIVLPGPPRELRAMWESALATAPARAVLSRAHPYSGVRLRLFGLPESEIAETLRATTVDLTPLEITTCLRGSELEVEIRHRPSGQQARDALVAEITRRHGRYLFSSDGSSIDEQVAGLLTGRRIGLAESCTGGLLAGRLTQRSGSSAYLAGGVVAYSNEAKIKLLDLPAELIERHGAVSPEAARAMADGALRRFGADTGCGVTGIAGPGGGTEDKPVGYVCVCVVTAEGSVLAHDSVLPGDRSEIRERSVTLAMHMLRQVLGGRPTCSAHHEPYPPLSI